MNRNNNHRNKPPAETPVVEMHVLSAEDLIGAKMTLKEVLTGAYVQEYPTIYIGLPFTSSS